MGVGPRTNLYNIGGDPLTQLICLIIIILFFIFSSKCVDKLTQSDDERKKVLGVTH